MPDNPVLEYINEVIADTEHANEVTVLPFMCGTGKSTAISYKIRETIEQADDTGNGLLIITDRKDRMDEYMHPHDEELKTFLQEHTNAITIMHGDNIVQAYKTFKFRPVLMMTTQRFFRLTPEEIEQFLQWKKDDIVHSRPLILIDERPELTTIVELNERKIHDCRIAVEHAFQKDAPFIPVTEIQSAEDNFIQFVRDCDHNVLGEKETINCFWTWFTGEEPKNNMKSRYQSIRKKREEINNYSGGTYYEDYYTRIRGIYHLVESEALFYRRWLPTDICLNSFFIFLNNTPALKRLNVKTIILDGTAKFSPEYRLLTGDIRNNLNYSRNLEHLKIHVINLPTSKSRMTSKQYQDYVFTCVQTYFEEKIRPDIGNNYEKCALFTYMITENKYDMLLPEERVEHFGNIIGKNDFRKSKHIIQVGINRYPDAIYYLYYLALHPEEKCKYENMQEQGYETISYPILPPDEYFEVMGITPEQWVNENAERVAYTEHREMKTERILSQSSEILHQLNAKSGEVHEIMDNMLFAELEQHIFRGIIRNSDCKEDYHFHLFTNIRKYNSVIKKMKQRYEPLGGSVFEDDSEKMMLNKIIRRNGESHVKRFIFWHDKQLNINDTYTPEDIRNASGIPNTENGIKIYEQMIRNKKNPVLKYLLEQERDNTKKRGMYKKRRNWCID